MDADQSGDVSDAEWSEFFTEFIEPFTTCDADTDYVLVLAELTACITTVTTSKILELKDLATHEADVFKYMDRAGEQNLTLYDYICLRKVVSALKTCGDGGYFMPNRLYCGLSITSPRSPAITSPVEREVFNAAIVLTDGFYYGQTSFLSPLQYIAVSYLYNYFGDYELPFNDGIVSVADFIRSA
jgi:hypothetical protein